MRLGKIDGLRPGPKQEFAVSSVNNFRKKMMEEEKAE